jgi:lysophospholipase L1-like esterase
MRFGKTDGLVLHNEFDDHTLKAIRTYFNLLEKMADECKKKDIKLIFVYFPAYPQIYLPDFSVLINETLKKECEHLQIDFIDLTGGFRKMAKERKPFHLTPIDYHLNPAGNELFAQLLAEYLKNQ